MRLAAVIGLAIALIGCVPATSAPSSSASGSVPADASPALASASCREIELQMPNGDYLDLTGTWLGNDASYWTFTQVGDCVWATATDEYTSFGVPTYWQVYLRGTLLPDLTVPVEFAYSPLGDVLPSHSGHAVLSIEIGAAVGGLTLRKTAGCSGGEGSEPCPPGEGTLQTTLWTLVRPTVILPPPTPQP